MRRRAFLAASTGAVLTQGGSVPAGPEHRVAIFGHTGRGNYGHDIDTVWLDVPQTRVVAVADPDPAGRAAAEARLRAPASYADFRELLEKEKPEFVAIATRWPDQHREMLLACAQAKVRGVLSEKPLAQDLRQADEMVAAADQAGMKVVIAHQTRYSPRSDVIRKLLADGRLGDLLEIRARGKEDSRGGGEDLIVLGDHLLDLMRLFLGDPQWCFARVTQNGKAVTRSEVRVGAEALGLLAGDTVTATFGFPGGVTAHFGSCRAKTGAGKRFGLTLYGTRGALSMSTGTLPPVWLLEDPSWTLFQEKGQWRPVSSTGVDAPEPLTDSSLRAGNRLAVADLLRCVADNRQPHSSIHDGRASLEMIMAVYESHRLNAPVTFPLTNRRHPLELL